MDRPDGERTVVKSAAAFRTIAEVGSELDVPAHVLRFWECKFPQIKPLKRRGGRRYYRPEDVALLHRIRKLLYVDGYTIKGVQRLLRGNRSSAVAGKDDELAEAPEGPLDASAAAVENDAPRDDDPARDDVLTSVLNDLQALRAMLRRRGS